MMIKEWFGFYSFIIPMTVQASLFYLVWKKPDYLHQPLIRWLRFSLLPITLVCWSFSVMSLRGSPHVGPFMKVNIGCSYILFAAKIIVLGLRQPQAPESKKPEAHSKQSRFQNFMDIMFVAYSVHPDPSKQKSLPPGLNHDSSSDLKFLLMTIRRFLSLHFFSVAALICLKTVNNENFPSHDIAFLKLIKYFQLEISAFCWGTCIWVGIDLMGCWTRVTMFTLKMMSRLGSRLFTYQPILLVLNQFNQTDLEQKFPFPFPKKPYQASSLTDFWSRHWHQLPREVFIEAGSVPVTLFLVDIVGIKPNSKFVRLAGVMGAFAISALMHEFGLWIATRLDPHLRTSVFFLSQGVGVCLENGFKKLFKRNVQGWIGRVWVFAWMIYFAKPMLFVCFEYLKYDQAKLFKKADDFGILRLLTTPLIAPALGISP